jgi:phage tail sheath protein FI
MPLSVDPTFGVKVLRTESESVPIITGDLSVVGIIGPADDADVSLYPLDTPVLVVSNDQTMLAGLGEDGFLKDGLRGVNGQLKNAQRAAVCVVVRTARGVNVNPAVANQLTIAKIMGDEAFGSGLYAFLRAPGDLQCTPRLLCAPGYTGLLATGVDDLTVGTLGKGYVPGATYPITFTGGGANAIQATGHAVADETGNIGAGNLFVDTPGAWYESTPVAALGGAAPTGENAQALAITAVTQQLANPLCAAFPTICEALLAHAVVESTGSSVTASQQWRETLNSERLIPVHGGVKVQDPVTGDIVVRPQAPRVIGIGVRRDYEKGAPFHSWANQPMYDIVGPQHSLTFSINSGANEGQILLSSNIGVLVSGQIGNDFAIADGGFLFVGTDNAGDDPEWMFYNVTRGRDFLNIAAIRGVRIFLGRENIDGQAVQKLVNTLRFMLRDFKSDNKILGYQVKFLGNDNNREEIRKGKLRIRFRAEEPPVMRRVDILSGRMPEAVDALVADLEASTSIVA